MTTEERITLLMDWPSANWKIDLRGLIWAYEGAVERLEAQDKADKEAWKAAFREKQVRWDTLRDAVRDQLTFLKVDFHADELGMIAQALVRRLG